MSHNRHSFSAGNFDFVMVSAHIRWGDSQTARTAEIWSFAEWLDLKRRQKHVEDKDFIVTGDFNIESPAMYEALTSKGLAAPAGLRKGAFGTNLARDKRYDQILHYPIYDDSFMNKGGVLDFYTGGTTMLINTTTLFPGMSKDDVTYQLSDHLPLWVQINTDNDAHHLDQIIRAKRD